MPGISRRGFLALSASVVIAACSEDQTPAAEPTTSTGDPTPEPTTAVTTAATAPTTTSAPAATTTDAPLPTTVPLDADPFALGVTSGDPDATSVVLWTRLIGSDLPDEVEVRWELLDGDEVVASGDEVAGVEQAHTVHAVVPIDRPLSYRFSAGGFTSPVGRAQPADGRAELRIAAANCQHYETGFYTAHRDIAEWQPDLVLFLGDFIYEGAGRPVGGEVVRSHDGPEPTDLDAYRRRYEQYLSDPDLQAARAACPWLVIWDDHEVENNYAGLTESEPGETPDFAARRAEAYRAWWEHMPTRLPPPSGEDRYEIYRGVDYGDFVGITVLDGRQFRTDQACGDVTLSTDPPCAEVFEDGRTMLGDEQEAWLEERWAASTSRWNVLGQQTVLTDARLGEAILNYDQWDGYPAAREQLLAHAPDDLVVITGDIHLAGVGTLGGRGVEFVTTSISSTANVPADLVDVVMSLGDIVAAEIAHRGYTRHTVTLDRWVAEFRIVDDIADPASGVSTWQTFSIDHGTNTVAAVG